jgi:superfamily I DNA/RNA helicase
MTVEAIKLIHSQNKLATPELNQLISEIFSQRLTKKRISELPSIVDAFNQQCKDYSLNEIIVNKISHSIHESINNEKAESLNEFKRKYLTRTEVGFELKTHKNLATLDSALELYETYQQKLKDKGFYDYEDMVNWAIDALRSNKDILLDIAEQYQYIMVDEFQDTNGSQNALL